MIEASYLEVLNRIVTSYAWIAVFLQLFQSRLTGCGSLEKYQRQLTPNRTEGLFGHGWFEVQEKQLGNW